MLEGAMKAEVLFVTDFLRINCAAEGKALGGHMWALIDGAMKSAGIAPSQAAFAPIHPRTPPGGKDIARISPENRAQDFIEIREIIRNHEANVIVAVGQYAFDFLVGLGPLAKWHCSVLLSKAEFGGRKVIGVFHPETVLKNFSDSAYLTLGIKKAAHELASPVRDIPERYFILNPDKKTRDKIFQWINFDSKAPIAIDIETGQGQINTVGFAKSAVDAIAIKVLPEDMSPEEHLELWRDIAKIVEGPRPKILQNFIFEATWFARYGIALNNVAFDTMWAMKFLHPEMDKGLDNVGRLYTPFPYWKDDNKQWGRVRNWPAQLEYNAKDTTGTYSAYVAQCEALKARNLEKPFTRFVMKFAPVIQEMCVRGLKLDPEALVRQKSELEGRVGRLLAAFNADCQARIGRTVNHRSPKQMRDALKELGMKLPKSKGAESVDKKALLKLRRKHPDDLILPTVISLAAKSKQLSTYFSFDYDRATNRVHYSIDGCGTEDGRWTGQPVAWDEGFNPQRVPKSLKKCFVADEGKKLIQISLVDAESRYVAWEAPEPRIIKALDAYRDPAKIVAGAFFRKPYEFINPTELRLGKKIVKAGNYGTSPTKFADQCGSDGHSMSLVQAKRAIDSYYELFPGILTRQRRIQTQLQSRRLLTTPMGRERYFYGRMCDSTFREAYAYCPQSVVSDVISSLTLKLFEMREYVECEFLLQVHDSLLVQAPIERAEEIAEFARDLETWQPRIVLPGGRLALPVSVEFGDRWGTMEGI